MVDPSIFLNLIHGQHLFNTAYPGNSGPGPYNIWHHEHHFEQVPGGVKMTDLVHYRLPLGWLGKLAHHLLVKQQLAALFEYRHKTVEKIFGPPVL